MNENLEASPNAIRLLKTRERGPTDGSVELTPGGGAKTAYPCDPGGELTIGYGCLKWFDGEDVNLTHRLSSEDEATALLKLQLKFFEDGVRAMLTREATQSQFDGMLCLAFNIGLAAFKGSSVLRFFNEGRMEDAAASFGMWTGATCTVVPRWLRNDPELGPQYAGKYALDHKGTPRWVGPDGQYCGYMLRLKGYMPRHYSEALLFLNREWEPTIDGPKRIRLEIQSDHPSRATWNGSKGRWEDGVKYRTPFKDVYAAAYDDLLPEPELILSTPLSPATPAPVTAPSPAVADKGSAPAALPSPAGASSPQVSPAPSASVVPPASVTRKPEVVIAPPAQPPRAPVPAPPKPADKPIVLTPQPINPNALPTNADTSKNMADSTRMIGMVLVAIGSVIQVVTLRLGIGTAIGAVFFDLSRDPVVITLTVTTIVAALGWVTKRNGKKTFAKGADQAHGALH